MFKKAASRIEMLPETGDYAAPQLVQYVLYADAKTGEVLQSRNISGASQQNIIAAFFEKPEG